METGVYFGLTTGRSVTTDICNITGMFEPGSFDESYTWALSDNTKIPPHITLLNRTRVDCSIGIDYVQDVVDSIGMAVPKRTILRLTPMIDPITLELFAKPLPHTLEMEILVGMTNILTLKFKTRRVVNPNPHIKIARLRSGRQFDFTRINNTIRAFPIHFTPTLVYANLVGNDYYRYKAVFSISRYHQNQGNS